MGLITADGDCSHEIKRCLLLRRKAMANLDSILKSRDITLPTKVHLVKAMVFPVVMYGYESWTINKADAFELWCWKRLLRVPWTTRRSNQSILKEIGPEYSLEGLMLKLKLQYLATLCEELTHLKRPWCWERLKAGGEGDDRGWDGWMASPMQWTWVWVNSGSWWWTGRPGVLQSMGLQRVGHNWATELCYTHRYVYIYILSTFVDSNSCASMPPPSQSFPVTALQIPTVLYSSQSTDQICLVLLFMSWISFHKANSKRSCLTFFFYGAPPPHSPPPPWPLKW